MADRPSFQFYPAEWRNNAKLQRCSIEARGAWMDVLCLLHDADEYGVLRWPLADIALAVRLPIKLLRELASKGVLKGADSGAGDYTYAPFHAGKYGEPQTLVAAGNGPCWYCSRFVKDEWKRQRRGLSTRFGADNQPPARTKTDNPVDWNSRSAEVLAKCNGHCHYCGIDLGSGPWNIDHVIPRSKGGTNHMENLVASCIPCNRAKSDTMPPTMPRQGERHGDGPSSASSSSKDQETYVPESAAADCPQDAIVALYHELLPSLRKVKVWNEKRQALLRKRWREDSKRQSLDYWRRFFGYVAQSPFLMGNAPGKDGRTFAADLEWLLTSANFVKVIEEKYHDRRA